MNTLWGLQALRALGRVTRGAGDLVAVSYQEFAKRAAHCAGGARDEYFHGQPS